MDAKRGYEAPASNAPSTVGAITAALLAVELDRALQDDAELAAGGAAPGEQAAQRPGISASTISDGGGVAVAMTGEASVAGADAAEADSAGVASTGRELYFELQNHNYYLSKLQKSPDCRFDHESWQIEIIADCRIGKLLGKAASIRVPGDAFVPHLACVCGYRRGDIWLLQSKHRESLERGTAQRCPFCTGLLRLPGALLSAGLDAEAGPAVLARRLSSTGLRAGDVFTLEGSDGERRHLQLELPGRRGAGVTVIMAGAGNIGSHLTAHLARMRRVGRLIICDPQVYEEANLAGQDVGVGELGRFKAEVQAERASAIRPDLEVLALTAPLESLPLGYFRDAYVIGCLDSRRARQNLNEMAWRCARAWLDGGVDGPSLLGRVSVYPIGRDRACGECQFSAEDYALLEQDYPCSRANGTTVVRGMTDAGSFLGATSAPEYTAKSRETPAEIGKEGSVQHGHG